MIDHVKNLHSDIAPAQGRRALEDWSGQPNQAALSWESSPYSIWGCIPGLQTGEIITLQLQGRIHSQNKAAASPGWIEVETGSGEPEVKDLFLVGTRPLPESNLTCICRCPADDAWLVAATDDNRLLLLSAGLPSNLRTLAQIHLKTPIMSMVCCGDRLLALEKPDGRILHLIHCRSDHQSQPYLISGGRILLPEPITALAENDQFSAWGLTPQGAVFHLSIPDSQKAENSPALVMGWTMTLALRLGGSRSLMAGLADHTRRMVDAVKRGWPPWVGQGFNQGRFLAMAYDGEFFWACRQRGRHPESHLLLQYDRFGKLRNSYSIHPDVSLSSLNSCHNLLLILDAKHGHLHQIYAADAMEAAACMKPAIQRHPGFLSAGSPVTGGIHDMCLLYVGGEGRNAVHRYDADKLKPLVGYISEDGIIQDAFMDGFLMLAQYSPLLNGRSFGVDLAGEPSRQEDWIALFEEYFHPAANLQSLDACAKQIKEHMDGRAAAVKVVLGIPTPDRRCKAWDDHGLSLAAEENRVKVTRWAMRELIHRWGKAAFRHLVLAGFYYMTEQGTLNDAVLGAFPSLCRDYNLRSYAIPGITSSWMTEFKRAGFDGVALQASHAFWQPSGRPKRYLLKCAGHIAREFGMGMEIEIPYDVLSPDGCQRLRDYLDMAHIQGWNGAFKAYFQSYNLIKSLAESNDPVYRQLYDDLYAASRKARQTESPEVSSTVQVDGSASWTNNTAHSCLRLRIEGHRGGFGLNGLVVERRQG